MLLKILLALVLVCAVRGRTYNIDVKTGSVSYAGTDANVFIVIYGNKGQTGKINLRSSQTYRNKFERYHLDKFTVQEVDVGRISKIRIGHDNKGRGPGWYLDNVVVNVKGTTCKLIYTANRWLKRKVLEATLYPVFDKTSCAQVHPISFQVCEWARPDWKKLTCPMDSQVIHIAKALYGRRSTKICGHAHHRGVTNCGRASSFTKAKRLCDGKKTCTLRASNSMFGDPCWGIEKYLDVTYECKSEGMTTYNIDVKTGNRHYAGTDANVFIIIYGDKGQTGKLILRTSQTYADAFERNHLDKFTLEEVDVGRITMVRVGHDNKGKGPGWYFHSVAIHVKDAACKMTFTASLWLQRRVLETTAYPVFDKATCTQGKRKRYKIDVKTSNVARAGTDANVFIIIYGEKYDTGKLLLTNSKTHSNPFERNHLDKFVEEGLDVGKITKIRIGHDNTKRHPQWHLTGVVVGAEGMTCKSSFHTGQLLKRGNLQVVLFPILAENACGNALKSYDIDVKTGNVRYAGTDANVFIIIYGEKGNTGKLILRNSKSHNDPFEKRQLDSFTGKAIDVGRVTSIRIGHDNTKRNPGWYLSSVVIGAEGSSCKSSFHAGEWLMRRHVEDELFPTLAENACGNALTMYDIDVKTGNVKYAGTNANVFIIIYGQNGNTGKLILSKSKTHRNPFEQRQLDSFAGKAVDVGRVTSIRIGHDNKGSHPGWYLDTVVIKVKSCKWTFSGWQWILKRKLQFDLYPTLEQGTCKQASSHGGICRRDFRKIGCFSRDWEKVPDLLITDLDPTHKNYTTDMNWDDYALGLHSLACRCRAKAVGHYKYFGMGFHGECVAGKNSAGLEKMFTAQKHAAASSTGCINGKLESCNDKEETECAGVADFDFFYEIVE